MKLGQPTVWALAGSFEWVAMVQRSLASRKQASTNSLNLLSRKWVRSIASLFPKLRPRNIFSFSSRALAGTW
jgi:hypothetical protein